MGWSLSTFTIVVFGSAVVAIAVGLAALRERPDPMAWPLAVLMFTIAAWAIPDAISLGYSDVGRVVFWQRMLYPGVVSAPVVYLLVTLRYAGYERWLTPRVYASFAVLPVITVVLVWTNASHGLFWRSITIARVGDASVLLPEYGMWYWVNLGYLYVVTIAALLVLGAVAVRSGTIYRKQAVLMFVGGLVPLATNVIMEFGVGSDPMVDLTTTALTVSGLTFALALFHLDLLEIRPVARDWLVDALDDGVVVVGPNGRIRDFNPTAARILGDVAIDQPAEEVLPSNVGSDSGELEIDTAAGERRFSTRSTTLTDKRGQDIGRIVYLNDVTEIVKREQRISVLNRIMRHNIRNELSVISGRLELLETHASGEDRETIETAKESARRVLDLAEKARHVERTIQEDDTPVVVSSAAIAEQVVAHARETFAHADIEFDLPEGSGNGMPVRVVDDELFETAIAELVENAVVHDDREPSQVVVRVERDADHVHVRVADTGPGIHDHERTVLTSPRKHLSNTGAASVSGWCSGPPRFLRVPSRSRRTTHAAPSSH